MPAEREVLVGGQAVLEGVMMKLPRSWAVTVRTASGELVSQSGAFVPWSERWPVLRLPLLRGVATLGSMMVLGFRSLSFSSDVMARDEQLGARPARPTGGAAGLSAMLLFSAVADGPDGTEPDEPTRAEPARATRPEAPAAEGAPGATGLSKLQVALSIVIAAAVFVAVFKAIPLGTAWLVGRAWPALAGPFAESVISGLTLGAVFVGYLFAMSLIPDIRRVFQYHGAEHKVVHLHEAGEEPTVANARPHPTQHPRCGTSFMFFVVLTSIVVWALFPVEAGFSGKLGLRLLLFPLILGLSYELIRLSARHRRSLFFRALSAPGIWSQRITTKPPDDGMLEVSLRSLALAGAPNGHEGQAPGP